MSNMLQTTGTVSGIVLGSMVLHVNLIMQMSLAAWQSSIIVQQQLGRFETWTFQMWNMLQTTGTVSGIVLVHFLFMLQGCTVRPKKDAGQCSMGGGGGGAGGL